MLEEGLVRSRCVVRCAGRIVGRVVGSDRNISSQEPGSPSPSPGGVLCGRETQPPESYRQGHPMICYWCGDAELTYVPGAANVMARTICCLTTGKMLGLIKFNV